MNPWLYQHPKDGFYWVEKVEQITSEQISWLRKQLLSNAVERFWSLESYGTCQKDDVSVLPLQERKALETLENTVQFADNHYR